MSEAPNTKLLYQQGQFPIFQNRVYDDAEEAKSCVRGEIRIVENQDTGLIYNEAFRPEVMDYDENYQNEQAVSPYFQNHLDQVAEIIGRSMGTEQLVEVGCGKGFFLEKLLGHGFDVTGFDPTYEGDNPRVKREYFGPDTGVKGKGLILRHVLEHIPDPVDFLFRLNEANGGNGKIYIEVPCFEWICERKAWFDIFYEHVNYFRLSDFHRIFGTVIESGHIFRGQYIYVVAELGSLRRPVRDPSDGIELPEDFSASLEGLGKHDTGMIWGAASKGVIFALMRERAGKPVEGIIDINPAKHGKYLAVTGLRVEPPEQGLAQLSDGGTIFVMNSNYLDEIKQMSGNKFKYVPIDGG